ncbi:YncE family protein [Erythrobacter sp. T5W1-R]|uniref:Vgb family protein n=1 Tax=Erythrobacter sp. T5W1-R TaxID=3101752 RepID=UPI003A4C79AA
MARRIALLTATTAHVLAVGAGCAAEPPATPAVQESAMMTEQEIPAPGFADFLVVDGDAVWVTNRGLVEKWAVSGKLAEVAMPRPCGTMAIAASALWVAECTGKQVYRIALASGAVETTIPTGLADPRGETNVVAGAGSVWVASDPAGKVARIDPASNTVVAEIAVAPGTAFLAFGFDAVWAVSSAGQVLQKIDPASNAVVGTVPLGQQPGFLAAGEGAVWVQEQGDGTVAKVDPAGLAVLDRVKVGANLKYGDIDTGGGAVWLRTTDDQTMVVIDPATLAIRARLGKPAGSGAVRYTPEGVWTSAHDNETISWWTAPAGAK